MNFVFILFISVISIFTLRLVKQYFKYNIDVPNTLVPPLPAVVTIAPPFPIDYVFSWAGEKRELNIRTSNNNELKYSLRSVMKYAPWINRIYVVVHSLPENKPSWFNDSLYEEKITLITHQQIFPQGSKLPNKNSNAIETCIHNIPRLSEHYVYSNDDFFLCSPTEYTDFFTPNGKAKVSDSIFSMKDIILDKTKSIPNGFPKRIGRFYPHVPIPLLKSVVSEYVDTYPKYIKWVRGYTIRNMIGCDMCAEFNLKCPCQQQHHTMARFMYDKDLAVPTNIWSDHTYIDSFNIENIYSNPGKFLCINDNELLEHRRDYIQGKMNVFFKTFYPEIPFYEVHSSSI